MFYSQFILAKKGPLGTIWIAAHLERKLRKNQVADTDIGESVDSILFPDVPIALRLSSHLLLGVVRIYSRKVNYLFNDCSETLVKIKQAFRSSAVDLPPEASTAPYHSITLPETFDLDDLELPESSFCHGNFVDHHVTTREQITLQDPVEDTAYLGSQFGLDERFGDGDAPQMVLDFDEDIFADRVSSPGPSSAATHLEEDLCPSAAATEGAFSNKMEIDGHQSSTPAIGSSHMDEDETRDHSTLQTVADHSGQQTDRDYSDVLPLPVEEVANVASKGIHRPDLNKEIFPCPMVQGPSTPRLMDEMLTAHVEEVPVSSSLQKNKLLNSAEGFVAAVLPQTGTSASYSVSGLSKRLEQVEMVMLSQHPNSHLAEEMKEADTRISNNEGVQQYKQCSKEQLLLVQQEVLRQSNTLHTHENVNLVRSANRLQEMMMKASKVTTVASDLHCTVSSSSLAVGTSPSLSVNAYGFDASKQMLPVHNMQVPRSFVQSTDTVFRAQDAYMLGLQQQQIGDWKKQSHSDSMSQEIPQISQIHCNQMSNTASQQNPLAIPAISTYLSTQQFNPASSLQSAVGILASQQLIHGTPASATVVPYMQQVSPMEFQQLNKQSKQQVQSSAESQKHVQETNIRNSLMSTFVHNNVTAMPTIQSCLSGQQFDLPSGFHSAVGTPCTQELPIHGFPSLLKQMPNKQEASIIGNIQHLNNVADKQPSYLGATTQERVQLTQPDDFVVTTSAQDFNKPMQSFPSSDERHNISLGHLSTISMPDTRQKSGNTPEPAYFATQMLLSPQRSHVTEPSAEVSSIAATDGPWLRACNEEEKKRQSSHASAAAGKYSLHGVQHVDSRTGDSASIFQSSGIPRVPTNIPLENTYTQSPSISISTGEQGFSKGLLDGSITAQPCNVPLEIGANGKNRDVPCGNIFQGARFPLQVGGFGPCENASSESILNTCSFATHAGTNAVSAHLASENILLQGNDFQKVIGSERFPTNITASKNSAPPSFQPRAFSVAYDELSNALSVSQVQGAATSKSEHFESIQSQPEAIKRSLLEISGHETLRSSVNSVRHEPDIFRLKRPRAEIETSREADKSATIAVQSVGSKKHPMMDRTPILKTVTPNPRSRSSLSNRSMDYIPHDDDVLASILGRTPSFKIKPTPAQTLSAKRPRPTPRTGRKRKAVIDIATVIDSNYIKQQLANTEDIRRVRKKAPCTLQEIRIIQKESQAHYIFFEPSIPGLCTELRDLYGQVFGLIGPKILLDENSGETEKVQESASSLGPTNDSRLEKIERLRSSLEMVSAETQKRQEWASSMGPTNDSSMEQLKRVGRPLETVSAETQKVQEAASSLSPINDFRMELEQVGRPLEIVSQMESIGVYVDNAHKNNMYMGNADGIREGVGNENAKQEQGRLLEMLSVIKINSAHMDNIHGKQEKEKPEEIAPAAESSGVHLYDFHKEPEQEKLQEHVSEVISSRGDTCNVHQSQDQETKQIVYETESRRLHMSDAYQKQEKERSTEMVYEGACGRVVPNVESNKVLTFATNQKQDQDRPQDMVVESESGRAHMGEVDQSHKKEQEMSKEMIYDLESSRMDVDDVQGKPASIGSLLQCPTNVIYGSKDPDINKTLEASVMQRGDAFANEVFVPRDNTSGCQFLGPRDNIGEMHLLNHESYSKPSWLAESHEKSLEDRRRLQGVAETCWASEGQKIPIQDLEVASKKEHESNCLGENHRIHVLQGKEGANVECVNEVSKIFCGSKPSYIEPNIAQDSREQNKNIPDIAILEHSPVNEKIEETVRDCEYQNQVVCSNTSSLPLQGKDSLPYNKDDLGESTDLSMPGKVLGSSVQYFGVENKKHDEQILVHETSTEIFCKEPEVSEDISLRDRQDQQGTHPVVLHTATDEDEDFGFLGDADNTEFLVVDDDAQGEFEGRSKVPVTEEDQIQENSGWSARTRAVSRYLKTVFESMDYNAKKPEAENRQKLSLDRLLVGKRRKEAARMFFETLVLKTRDYVDVEQKDSFNDISIYPRTKLMKANF